MATVRLAYFRGLRRMTNRRLRPSSLELRAQIATINRLDLDVADYGHLVRRVGQMIVGVPLACTVVKPGTRLYRARKNRTKLLHVAELGAPPAVVITNYQRCNPPNEPMFYGATHQATACHEIRAQLNDIVYVSCWTVRSEFFAQVIPPDWPNTSDDSGLHLLASFFETKFSQPIHETFSNQYKVTSAIADRLTAKEFSIKLQSDAPDRDAFKQGVGCIIYPSVSHPARPECVALRPTIVTNCLDLTYVEEWEITAANAGEISINRLDIGSSFVADEIIWTGKPLHWTLREKGQTITATVEPDGWVVRDARGNIFRPG